jgi:hypothetical protein
MIHDPSRIVVLGAGYAGLLAAIRLAGRARGAMPWDILLYALGSGPALDAIPGLRAHAHHVATEDGARRLSKALDALPAHGRVAVCGGGLTAIATAAELAEVCGPGVVTLVTAAEIGAGLSPAAQAYARDTLRDLGVATLKRSRVAHVAPGAVTLDSGAEIPADVTVWCGGFVPAPLANEAGLDTDGGGRLSVDPMLRASAHPLIFGAGDAVGRPHRALHPHGLRHGHAHRGARRRWDRRAPGGESAAALPVRLFRAVPQPRAPARADPAGRPDGRTAPQGVPGRHRSPLEGSGEPVCNVLDDDGALVAGHLSLDAGRAAAGAPAKGLGGGRISCSASRQSSGGRSRWMLLAPSTVMWGSSSGAPGPSRSG